MRVFVTGWDGLRVEQMIQRKLPWFLLTLAGLLISCGESEITPPPFTIDGSRFPGLDTHPDGSAVMSWV